MDPVPEDLVPEFVDDARLAAGLEILRVVRQLKFPVSMAGWIFGQEDARWRLYLASPAVLSQGPRWVYERLLKVFRVYPLPAFLSPLDIVVVDQILHEHIFGVGTHLAVEGKDGESREIRYAPRRVGTLGALTFKGQACFYMPSEFNGAPVDTAGDFDRNVSALAA